MNNMYDILAKLDTVAKQSLTEGAATPVVKTQSGFTAQAPAGKKLQTTLPRDRPLQPQDVKVKEQEFPHRASPTFGHSHRMQPGYDPTFRSPIDSPAGSEIEELEYLMSKGAMNNAEEMRLRSLYNKFGIRSQQDMAKIPQLRQQELDRIERTQAELQRKSAEANVASRDEMERQRAARAGIAAQPRSDISTTAGFRAAYDRAGRAQPPVREGDELEEQAAFRFSPEQEKWLGSSNRQDPYILARMPGPKPPISYFTDPEDRAIAQRLNFGQQNLNRIKSLVGQKPGSADVFATKPGATKSGSAKQAPADTSSDISTTAGFRAALDRAAQGQSTAPAGTKTPQSTAPAGTKTPQSTAPAVTPVKISPGQSTTGQAVTPVSQQPAAATGQAVTPVSQQPAAATGQATSWRDIYNLNRDTIGDNPNIIRPGQQLRMPDGSTYTVKPGDNLTKIARGRRVTKESRNRKPDFPDIDNDGDRTEPIAKAAKDSIGEGDVDEGNDFTGARLAAIRAGKPTFRVNGKTYKVTGDTSDEKRMDEGYVDFFDKKQMYRKIGADVEGRSDDYTVTFRDGSRKRFQELDGRRRVTTLEPVDRPEEQDDEGNVVKRGRGRPKGSKRSLGAKGPSGKSKLLTREQGVAEDYDKDEYDEEGEMAKSQARTIEDAAQELQDILDDDQNLPEWVQKKIVLAKEYIDSARDYMKANPDEEEVDVEVDDEEFMAEKAVSKAQRAAAGIAHAARKGDIPKSELRGASKEMAKMPAGELKKFAKTKEKGLPEKKQKTSETTVAGSVAPAMTREQTVTHGRHKGKQWSPETPGPTNPDYREFDGDIPSPPDGATAPPRGYKPTKPPAKKAAKESDEAVAETDDDTADKTSKKGKNSMQFGKGVYESQIAESFERRLAVLTEGMNINMSMDENGRKSLTVNATDDDAEQLADLLKMAGLQGRRTSTCEVCGGHEGMHEAGCDRRDMVEEELANSPDPVYAELGDTRDYGVSGGLNGPKLQSNPNNMADNPLAMSRLGSRGASGQLNLGAMAEDIEQKLENRLIDLYKRIQ